MFPLKKNTNITKTITVNIIGGLGNQMFQYAFGYAASKENNAKIKLALLMLRHSLSLNMSLI